MNHIHTSSGKISIGGCSAYIFYKLFYIKYKVGSIVYSRPKASKGIIEKIVIKKIRLFPEQENSLNTVYKICNFPPLYIDTLNGYHNEEDLVGSEDAVKLVDQYLERQKQSLENNRMNNC